MAHSAGNNSGQLVSSPLEVIVVIRMPTVARINGEGSPTAERHDDLMNSITSGLIDSKWALTLFFRISPLNDLVGSSTCNRKRIKH